MITTAIVAILAIAIALAFDFVNGFHDTANAVATVIYTKALKPNVAIAMSGLLNFLGALVVGTAVAKVITKIIPQDKISLTIIVAVLLAALIWNVLTWLLSLPVSSSHCLIASLFGAGIAAHGTSGVNWDELNKVIISLLLSPIAGFIGGALITKCALSWAGRKRDNENPQFMRMAQILSSASVSFTHGSNDGQKTMGIITLLLAMQFHGYTLKHVPMWVMVAAAFAMGIGTMIGGWRIIRTVGTKITHEEIKYEHGFGAECSTAIISYLASMIGAPISTTHTLTSAVAGGTVPSAGFRKLNFKTMQTIVLAWVLTLPAAATISACTYLGLHSVEPAHSQIATAHL